jgi:hypothetical protein
MADRVRDATMHRSSRDVAATPTLDLLLLHALSRLMNGEPSKASTGSCRCYHVEIVDVRWRRNGTNIGPKTRRGAGYLGYYIRLLEARYGRSIGDVEIGKRKG